MTRFLIFLFPALMDMVFGTMFYVCPVRVAEAGGSALAVAGVVACWAITYMITNQIVGSFVNSRNAPWMLVCSSFAVAVLAILFIFVPGLIFQYIWVVFMGIVGAFFFCPFQAFMKEVDSGSPYGIARSTGLYTFSWSMGLACGPFVSAFVWTNAGWEWCHALNGALGIITALGIIFLKNHASSHSSSGSETKTFVPKVDYSKMPDIAWLGWLASGVGAVVVALIRGVFPRAAVDYEVSILNQGMIIGLLSFSQSITGLCLCWSKTWMYRPLPVAAFGLCGVAASAIYGFSQEEIGFYIASILFGIYSGGFYFYLVFHSLVHPNKSSRYVAINESIIGGAGIAGPLCGGLLADGFGISSPFYWSAVCIAIVLAYQVYVHFARRKEMA
jgi:DHA1 family quinolone resistance protein-like MFS transporter